MSSYLRNLNTMLRAMVVCRGIACFLGYPTQIDPTFTDLKLLLFFSRVIDSCAQSDTLWDFNSFDVASVFSPLLDYAEMILEAQGDIKTLTGNRFGGLKISDIEWMQKNLTFLGASVVVGEIDTLTRELSNIDSWTKWFGFIRYTKSIEMEGLPDWCPELHANDVLWKSGIRTYGITFMMMDAMEQQMGSQNFFITCCTLQDYILGYKFFKQSFDYFFWQKDDVSHQALSKHISTQKNSEIQDKTARQLIDETGFERPAQKTRISIWSNTTVNSTSNRHRGPLEYQKLTMSSELIDNAMFTPIAISARMAELIEGSIEEPKSPYWYNQSRF